ncbi:ribonuclease HI family protein [Undibacterium sp. RuTC16W]|uniref:ribonuclease HI family protein n=1 Tax=Undibacterium sp. RuTC16W TaxID=3413048 RepID=UPI003BF16116
MPTHDLLLSIAFKAELKQSRRLIKAGEFTEESALQRVLQKQAGEAGLDVLIQQRQVIGQKRIAASALRQQQKSENTLRRQASASVDAMAYCRTWQAWFDGSAHPNPGKIGIGGVLISPDGQRIEISRRMPDGDNNEAEFHALQSVLLRALELGVDQLRVWGDSRVVIDTINNAAHGIESVAMQKQNSTVPHFPSSILQTLFLQSVALASQFRELRLHWIPRERNAIADALSQAAILKSI